MRKRGWNSGTTEENTDNLVQNKWSGVLKYKKGRPTSAVRWSHKVGGQEIK